MRRIRLFVDMPLPESAELDLPDAAAEHAVRVLRLRVGDTIVLFNGDGNECEAELLAASRREARVRVGRPGPVATESPLPLVLAQGIARGEKMDWIVQKATELGVVRIVPLHTERSEVKLDAARSAKRHAHWLAVAAGACEQSGRARLPRIDAPQPLVDWLRSNGPGEAVRLALLPEAGVRARELAVPPAGAVLAVGPEGGWGERDRALLRDAGFGALHLGPRILRTETAGLAALAALQALHGDG